MDKWFESPGFSIGVTVVACIGSSLLLGPLLCRKFLILFRWLGIRERNSLSRDDVAEIKNITLQITRDWVDMVKLIADLRQDHSDFGQSLQDHIEAQKQALRQDIIVSLEEEFLRNDQRFAKVKMAVEAMQEDLMVLKNSLRPPFHRAGDCERLKVRVDEFVQTDHDLRRRFKDDSRKGSSGSEQELSKINFLVKKCLVELLNEAKLCLYSEREEENKELQAIFGRLSEDRESIKNTIAHAFSMAAAESKKNYDRIGRMGQDAVRYLSTLYANTNQMLKTKLEETDDRLKDILSTMSSQTLDVASVRSALESIDGQFDHIFQRVELSCVRNTESCDEIAQQLEKACASWESTSSQLGGLRKDFTRDIQSLKEILAELKKSKEIAVHKSAVINPPSNKIVGCSPTEVQFADQRGRILSEQEQNIMFMYSLVQTCWNKMTSLNSKVESGCVEICELIAELSSKLGSVNGAVARIERAVQELDVNALVSGPSLLRCPDADSSGLLSVGDSGDCVPSAKFQKPSISGSSRERKIQQCSAILREKELDMVELLLRKARQESSQGGGSGHAVPPLQLENLHSTVRQSYGRK